MTTIDALTNRVLALESLVTELLTMLHEGGTLEDEELAELEILGGIR